MDRDAAMRPEGSAGMGSAEAGAANSSANSLRLSQRELRWVVRGSLTARRCVVTPRESVNHGVRDTGRRAGGDGECDSSDRKSVV